MNYLASDMSYTLTYFLVVVVVLAAAAYMLGVRPENLKRLISGFSPPSTASKKGSEAHEILLHKGCGGVVIEQADKGTVNHVCLICGGDIEPFQIGIFLARFSRNFKYIVR